MYQKKGGPEYQLLMGPLVYGQAEGGSPRIVDAFYRDLTKTRRLIGTIAKLDDVQAKRYATEENIRKISNFAAMEYVEQYLSDTSKEYDALINDKATPNAKRHQYILQKNYVRRLASGVLYGQMPPAPGEDMGLSQDDIDNISADIQRKASKQVRKERRTDRGPSDVASRLADLMIK